MATSRRFCSGTLLPEVGLERKFIFHIATTLEQAHSRNTKLGGLPEKHLSHQSWPPSPKLAPRSVPSPFQAFILCRLDYCNSLLFGISDGLLRRLQSVQNAAARLVTGARRSDHITPVLRQLHWLPVRQRVVFKMAGLVHQSLGGLAPAYLADDCRLLSDVGRHPLRTIPMTCGSCLCREHIINSVIEVSRPPVLDCGTTFHLDSGGRDLPFDSFRQSLKTHLFGDRSA